jgi:hypothetical protein
VIASKASFTISDPVAVRAGKLFYSHLLSGKTITQSFIDFKCELENDPEVADMLQGCCCEHDHTKDCPWIAWINNGHEKKTDLEVR